jgi:hypothetical protein
VTKLRSKRLAGKQFGHVGQNAGLTSSTKDTSCAHPAAVRLHGQIEELAEEPVLFAPVLGPARWLVHSLCDRQNGDFVDGTGPPGEQLGVQRRAQQNDPGGGTRVGQ